MVPNTGPSPVASRRQALAAVFTAYSQDLQRTEDRTIIVYPSRGLHTHRTSSLPWGVFCRERWRIQGIHRSHKTSQNKRGGLRKYFQGICDQPPKQRLLSFHPAVMPRNHHVETLVPSERSAHVGDFHPRGHPLLPHPHSVDA